MIKELTHLSISYVRAEKNYEFTLFKVEGIFKYFSFVKLAAIERAIIVCREKRHIKENI